MLLLKLGRIRIHINKKTSAMQTCFSISILILGTESWRKWKELKARVKKRKES